MGAWGTALYSDDTACDVRDSYRDLIGDGLSGPQATDTLLREWRDALSDIDEASVFWLALADTQWRCGRLEQRVKQKALDIIENRSDLRRWEEDAKLLDKRVAVLLRLRTQLVSRQPPERAIAKRYRDTCDWQVGEIISYLLPSEKLLLLRVIGHHRDKGGTAPVCEILDWLGDEIPKEDTIKHLPVKEGQPPWNGQSQFMVGRLREKELPIERVERLNVRVEPSQKPGGYLVLLWRDLDKHLQELFGIV